MNRTKQEGENPKKKLKLKKDIQKYCKGFIKQLLEGKIDKPSSSDCWNCYFKMPMGTDHLYSHIQEKYYVPSLLMEAINAIPISLIAKQQLGYLMKYHDKNLGDLGNGFLKKQAEKSLRHYLYQKLGLAK